MNEIAMTNGVFATPLFRAITDNKDLADSLKSLLLKNETDQFRNPDSQRNLFESKFDLLHWPDPEIEKLKNILYGGLMQYVKDANGINDEAVNKLTFKHESWFHITRKGAFFQPHTHPLASASLVYCVDPGDEELANNESGHLVMTDPRHNASMYLDPANRNMSREYSFHGLRLRLKKDELIIFPSYLQHHVEPYMGETPRITIAANFSFKFR